MAERKDAIALYAEKEGIPYGEAVKSLTELNKGFEELYVRGRFDLTKPNDRQAHNSLAAAFAADKELFAAFDSWRRAKYGEGMKDTILEASNTLGLFNPINSVFDAIVGEDAADRLKKSAMEPYGFVETLDGNYIEPWRSEQAQDAAMEAVRGATPPSDADKDRDEKEEASQKANELAEQQGAQNVFNIDQDPRTAAIRQRVDSTKFDPFLQGTQGQRSIINDLLDKSSRKIAAPNLGDPRSVSKFNNSVSSREFVRNNALKKLRDLDDMADSRREIVKRHIGAMTDWEAANKGNHPMADKGVENWSDQDKINFVKNFHRSNSTPEKYEEYKERTKDPLEKEYERKLKALQESRELPPQNPFNEETKKDAMFIAPRQAELLLAEDPYANTTGGTQEKSIGQSILDAREDVLRSEAASRPPNTVDTSLRDAARAERENVFREKYANNPARVQREAREAQLRGLSSPRAERDSRYQLPAYSQQTLDAPAPAPAPAPFATSSGFSLNTKDSSAPDLKEKAFADLEEAEQAEGLRSQIADVRGQIQNQQDILDLKNQADRELDARYATQNAAKAARNAGIYEARRMAKEQNVADTKNYYNQQVPVYGRRNDGTLGLMHDPNSYKTMKERSQVMGGLQKYGESDPFGSYMEEEKKRRKNQNIFG